MNQKKVLLTALLLLVFQVALTAGERLTVPSKGYRTIQRANVKARRGDTIVVKDGTYKESIFLKDGIVLLAENKHKATIDGGGHGIAVTLGTGSTISGLVITNATIGIFNKSPNTTIEDCLIKQNWMTGVMAVRHLPQTNDNTIVFNKASGIVVWDTRSINTSIEHNTIAYNIGFGLYVGGTSEIVAENNTVAFNQKYGFKMSDESSKSTVKSNHFFDNLHAFYDMPIGNHSFDPQFKSPRVLMDFQPNSKCCAIRSSKNENLGVRFSKTAKGTSK